MRRIRICSQRYSFVRVCRNLTFAMARGLCWMYPSHRTRVDSHFAGLDIFLWCVVSTILVELSRCPGVELFLDDIVYVSLQMFDIHCWE